MYVFIALCVSTLDTWPSSVGRMSASSLDLFCSMRVLSESEVAEGFMAVSNIKLATHLKLY